MGCGPGLNGPLPPRGAVTPVEPPALVEEAIDPPVEPTEPEPGGAFLEEDDGIPKRVLIGIDQGGLMRARTDISVEDAGGNIIPRPSRWNIALLEVAKIVNELDDEDEFAVYRFFGGY
ncbi:MAG: hypothetical protein L6Q71_08880 [Planctomycetes bacterium]|nr:hypothetical protein [Planctomycetota bacterium]